MSFMSFNCVRCGHCCTRIRGPTWGQVHGLTLLPSEIDRFPKELIKPMYRYSLDDPFTPGRVFMYQLDTEVCPRYDREEGCRIYADRPTLCRAFPMEITFTRVMMNDKCPQVKRLVKGRVSLRVPRNYMTAATKIHKYYIECFNPYVRERFDLETETWRGLIEGITEEDLKQFKVV